MSLISILITILILSLVVVIHEFGHFILARKNGVFVKEFSIGFGPRIITHVSKKSGTRFSVRIILFGGSCRMLGAMEDEEAYEDKDGAAAGNEEIIPANMDDERSFDKKSVWARMSIVLAGPVFNFFLAFVLAVIYIAVMGYDPAVVTSVTEGSAAQEAGLEEGDVITNYNGTKINFGREIYLANYFNPIDEDTGQMTITYERDGEEYTITVTPTLTEYYVLGLTYYSNADPAEIIEISDDSPLEEAGLREGDIILSIDGTEIASGEELEEYFTDNPLTAESVTIVYERKGTQMSAQVTPAVSYRYLIGFSYNLQDVKTNALGVIRYSFAEVKYQIVSVVKSLGWLLSGNGSLDDLSGPVGIVEVVDDTYEAVSGYGVLYTVMSMVSLTMLITANLGVLNLLPIPALDGGKFILLVIEAVRRKPLQKKYEGVITMIGALLIILLAVVVLVNDVIKLF